MVTAAGGASLNWHWRVISLALPIILANLTQPLLSLVDTAIAGHLPGAAALGGVALGGLFFGFIFWSFGFLRMGTSGLVAQAQGADDHSGLLATLCRALLLAVGLGAAILLLQGPLLLFGLKILGGSPAVLAAAHDYCAARIWSAPATLGNFVVLGALLGRQKVGLGLVVQIVINGLNAVAALIFVYGLGWGIAGIGAATAFADWGGLLLGLGLLWHLRQRGIGWPRWAGLGERAAVIRLFAVNRDIFLRTLCLLASFGWFMHSGAAQGDQILAANAVLLNFQSFMAYGLDGFAQAAETLVGAAIGARDSRALRAAIRVGLLWAGLTALGFAAIYAVLGPVLIALLTDQADLRALAGRYLPWAAASPLVSVWSFQLDGIFIGATRTRELRDSVALAFAGFLTAALVLQPILGNDGLWLAFMLLMLLRGGILAFWLPRIWELLE